VYIQHVQSPGRLATAWANVHVQAGGLLFKANVVPKPQRPALALPPAKAPLPAQVPPALLPAPLRV
jgi:hypothetical protein